MMDRNIAISGSLEFLNLGELLQILGTNNSTGILRLMSKYTQNTGMVYIDSGNPVDSSNGSLTGIDALFSLFGWVEGDFEFSQESIKKKNIINKNRMEIILDGTRLVDDGKVEKVGPVSYKKDTSGGKNKEKTLPIIKGPFVDYTYVVDEEEFFDGDDIVIEGNYGSWMWVILEGIIEIAKDTPKGLINLLRISEGAFIGSVASFFSEGNVRSATAKAIGHVQLGMLDSQRLSAEYAAMSPELRGIIKSLDSRMKLVTACAVDKHLNPDKQNLNLKDKKVVIEQGKTEERLFMITNGTVTIVKNAADSAIPLMSLEKGDFFGKIPFLNMGHEPHSASALASADLKITAVDSKALQTEYNQLTSAFKSIIENLATYISVTTSITTEYHEKLKKPVKS